LRFLIGHVAQKIKVNLGVQVLKKSFESKLPLFRAYHYPILVD
jgi:hypothetical protein